METIRTSDLRMLFDVLVVIVARVSIDNEKNIKELLRVDGALTLIIVICIILAWILYFPVFFFGLYRTS